MATYTTPIAGLPDQTALHTGRSVFTDTYAFIPRGVMRDIVTSYLPHWTETRAWVIARPMTGFSETFSQYVVEVFPGGGSEHPDTNPAAEGVLFVAEGLATVIIEGKPHVLRPGGYAYLPPGCSWSLSNKGEVPTRFHWIRKRYEPVDGIGVPPAFVANEQDEPVVWMPDTKMTWGTTRFVDPTDLRHDMHVNIVTLEPGAVIPFEETHVMEHGLYVLEGKAVYRLNQDWVEVEAGYFMWLRAFCPQACYTGPNRFRYLLYKDVNRHMKLDSLTRTVRIEPLTRDAYAPFGQVIETAGAQHYPINGGMTERYHDLARVELGGVHARPLVSIARGKPYALPLTLKMVERHPLGSQAFYPLSPRPFLSIVAPDEHGVPGTPRAFLTTPGQGINMAMNTWHGVLTPLGEEADFLIVDRGGEGNNLEEYFFDEPWLITA